MCSLIQKRVYSKILVAIITEVLCIFSFENGCDIKESNGIRWIPASNFDSEILEPSGATDHGQGVELMWLRFVARGIYEDGLLPGQFSQRTGTMYSAFNGAEIMVDEDNTELFMAPPGWTSWLPVANNKVRALKNLIEVGVMPGTGETLFVCRGLINESEMVGIGYFTTGNNSKSCTVSNYDKAYYLKDFEVLVMNNFGMLLSCVDT